MLALAGVYLARIRGEHWRFTPDEVAELSAAIAEVMVYVPLPSKELGVALALSNLATCLFMVAWPRLEVDAKLRQAAEARAAVAAAEGITGGGGWNGA